MKKRSVDTQYLRVLAYLPDALPERASGVLPVEFIHGAINQVPLAAHVLIPQSWF
ncbi:MAG: hypothetical protein H0U54_14620 [Acidobacteria bacterium]|nr:hypothetical protein [Acidobacteriota bacterium]